MLARFRLPADDLEYAVLTKLWELDVASVPELHEHFGEPEGLACTTTAKAVDRLRAKGLMQRERKCRIFRYRPKLARDEIERAGARRRSKNGA